LELSAIFLKEAADTHNKREHELVALLGCYAAQIGSYLPKFWGYKSALSARVKKCLILEDGTDSLTRNLGN
jgi:hypothetical protein